MGLSNELSCEAGIFSYNCNPHRIFSVRDFEALFPHAGTLGCTVCLTSPIVPPSLSVHKCGTTHSASPHLARSACCCFVPNPLHPGCLSPHLLLVWMNVSSLTLCLWEFHTVRFSGSSFCFLFLNLFLSFFWLCAEAQCIYLCLHLVRKSVLYDVFLMNSFLNENIF